MCVRYTLHKSDAAIASISKALGSHLDSPDWFEPRFNASLTNVMPVVACGAAGPQVRPMAWGFVADENPPAARRRLLANARVETVTRMPAFRQAASGRRCLVPANGFYEWRARGRDRLPYLFTLKGDEPFAFAGLWDPAGAAGPETFCILTTEPNELMAPIHDRMPVLLDDGALGRWLGDTPLAAEELGALTRPLESARMECRRVSRFVSNSRHEGPGCLEPAEEEPPEFDFG